MTNIPETSDTPTTTAAAENGGLNNNANPSEDKGHTFRKRRLSLTNLRQYDATTETTAAAEPAEEETDNNDATEAVAVSSPLDDDKNNNNSHDAATEALALAFQQQQQPDNDDNNNNNNIEHTYHEEEKAHSFRKRRLSLTHNREELRETEETHKRRRRASDASNCSIDSTPRLKSRTVHAAELLAHPPPSPHIHRNASLLKLYTQSAPPQQQPLLDTIEQQGLTPLPKWRKRHTRHLHEDETTLPFPRDIVGTFSCHGVEPIYDDDYRVDDDDDDDDDEPWMLGAKANEDKPTMAAKINQDRGGVAFPYGNCAKTALFAVYDGHGQGGELVSQFALHEVQRRLEKHPDFSKQIEKAFKETFVTVDESLKDEVLIEPLYAGTTACVALLRENKLVLANSGDSRAVMARRNKTADPSNVNNGGGKCSWSALDLTVDQNPDLPEEQARIEDMGGYVSPPPEPGLSARVWLDMDCTQIGLAMARSIGDHAVKEIGVIAEPVVSFHDVVPEDDFVIFATDGVWEFISSEEAVNLVAENLDRGATKACQTLIEAAAAKWHDEEGDYRDDITALVVRLQHLWKSDDAPLKTS